MNNKAILEDLNSNEKILGHELFWQLADKNICFIF